MTKWYSFGMWKIRRKYRCLGPFYRTMDQYMIFKKLSNLGKLEWVILRKGISFVLIRDLLDLLLVRVIGQLDFGTLQISRDYRIKINQKYRRDCLEMHIAKIWAKLYLSKIKSKLELMISKYSGQDQSIEIKKVR